MPIWMRRHYLNLVRDAIDRENKANDRDYQAASKKFSQNQQTSNRIQRPDIRAPKNIAVNSNVRRK